MKKEISVLEDYGSEAVEVDCEIYQGCLIVVNSPLSDAGYWQWRVLTMWKEIRNWRWEKGYNMTLNLLSGSANGRDEAVAEAMNFIGDYCSYTIKDDFFIQTSNETTYIHFNGVQLTVSDIDNSFIRAMGSISVDKTNIKYVKDKDGERFIFSRDGEPKVLQDKDSKLWNYLKKIMEINE